MFIVYRSRNNINNKKYIGADSNNNPKYFGSGIKIKNAINKYGIENFSKEILEQCKSEEHMFERETYWIDFYDAVNSNEYYNISQGGKGGNKLLNLESYEKWLKNTPKLSDYTRLHFKGKTYEEIYGIDAKLQKEKRGYSLKGKKRSKKVRQNISKSLKGKIPWNKGLTKEDERVKKYVEKTRINHPFKIFILLTPKNEIEFQGKKELEQFIKKLNNTKVKGTKINIDELISKKVCREYKLKIKKYGKTNR